MTVEYDGTDFAGFQTQAAGLRTVQGDLFRAVERITGEQSIVHGAGRTDAGVHALGQVVHFSTASTMPIARLEQGLNAVLPSDVSVRSSEEVGSGFHARYSATRRSYVYMVLSRAPRSAIWARYSHHEPRRLDLERMCRAAETLVGTHDFSAFANAGGDPGSTMVRHLERLRVGRVGGGNMIAIRVSANAFLRSMVRNIVGLLLDVGRGALPVVSVGGILDAKDRTLNPCATAPAKGLCLYRVEYGVIAGGERDERAELVDEEG
jgi:tRNA pseudouridine38-40 synthase